MDIGLDNFENLVDSEVLQRGLRYYEDGMVMEIEELGKHDFNAIILGSEAYSVNIVLDKSGAIFTHRCSCPYDYSPICKHKAALLFAIRNANQKGERFDKGYLNEIMETSENASKETLQQLLMELAKKSIPIRNEILVSLGLKE